MKEPLLLLHGAISSKKQFDVLLPFLEENFEVFVLDFPGHGGRAIPEVFSIQLFTNAILRYLDEQKVNTISIFGYSMGGYVALYLAVYHPERIKKVFTLATKFDWNTVTAEKEASLLNPEKISEKVPAFAAALREIHAPQDWEKVLEKTAAMLLDLGRMPTLTEKEFNKIEIPVIVGIGEQDKMVSIRESQNAARHMSNAKLLQLPDTPHPFEKVYHKMLSEHMKDFFKQE